jgi:hypothetical protein
MKKLLLPTVLAGYSRTVRYRHADAASQVKLDSLDSFLSTGGELDPQPANEEEPAERVAMWTHQQLESAHPIEVDHAPALVSKTDHVSIPTADIGLIDHPRTHGQPTKSRPANGPDAVPENVVTDAKSAFRQRTQGALAALVFDSVVEDGDPADQHRLRFEHPLMDIDLQVSVRSAGSYLLGKVTPGIPVRVEIRRASGETACGTDLADGVFSLPEIRHGLVRLRFFDRNGLPIIHTDWFRV